MPTMKQFDKKVTEILDGDTSLSKDAVLETIATKVGVSVDVLSAAFAEQVKLGPEIIAKMAEALEMEQDCPPGQTHGPDGECVPEGPAADAPAGETKGKPEEKPKTTELSETLESTFGKDDLKNGFNSVLEAIKTNKDPESVKYLSEVMRKVFEVMPQIFKTDSANKNTIDSVKALQTTVAEQSKTIKELAAKVKTATGLTESLKKNAKTQAKGLYETKSSGDKKVEKTDFEKKSLSETVQGSDGSLPTFEETK